MNWTVRQERRWVSQSHYQTDSYHLPTCHDDGGHESEGESEEGEKSDYKYRPYYSNFHYDRTSKELVKDQTWNPSSDQIVLQEEKQAVINMLTQTV